jgi:hypothetical protein
LPNARAATAAVNHTNTVDTADQVPNRTRLAPMITSSPPVKMRSTNQKVSPTVHANSAKAPNINSSQRRSAAVARSCPTLARVRSIRFAGKGGCGSCRKPSA